MLAAAADGRAHPPAHAHRLAQWCVGTACGIALVALAGWVLDVRVLAGQWRTYLPMPPSLALGVLLLGGGIFSQARWPSRSWVRGVALAGASLPALLGLLVLVEFVSGYDSGLEYAVSHTREMVGTSALGRMSPISAAALLLESAALLLMLHLTRWRVAAAVALLFAMLATVVHLVVLLGYLYGAPLLYGGSIRPVAAPAAMAFVLLGVGLGHLLLPRVPALRAWQRGTMRGILLRAFLPAMLLYVVLDGWADSRRWEVFRSTNPALWHALVALAIGGLFVAIIAWVASRTGDEIESAHAAQGESEERFRLAVDATNDGMWDHDLRNGTVRFSERYRAAFGAPSESEESWAWWSDHVHPEDRDQTLSSYNAAVNGSGDVWKCEYRFRRIDGTWANTSDRAHITRDSTGKAQYVIGALSDITESKRATEALRENETRLRDITSSLADWVWETDEHGVYTYSSQKGRDLFGQHPEDIIGKTPFDFMAPAEAQRVGAIFSDIVARKAPIKDLENWNIRTNGERICLLTNGVPILDEAGHLRGYRGVDKDITERRRAEEEQAKLQVQLQQAQKMESVGRLAGGVAHDFNNMLGVILGHAELALGQVDADHALHADLDEIRKAAMRSADLTRQLLAFARKQTVAPKVLDLNETVGGMLTMLRRLIGEGIDLRWQPGADLWPVKIDPSQIDQILANLCVNARDAIAGIGKMTIETANYTLDEDYCAAHAGCAPGEYARLAVSDDGSGMDKDTLLHVFEPFFTTKSAGEGTGLGLATVYGVVKQNSGFINVYSEPGQGTTFTIYLRRHVDKAVPAPTEGAAIPARRGHETILLVEDEPAILALTKTLLERQGYSVVAAGTPGEAFRLAQAHTGEIHLLMTDVVMPEMNGRTLATNLLSVYPHLKRLIMSGYTADVISHHGVLDEGVQFIQKPFTMEGLSAKVRDALDAQN